ncbi:hypothetical protein QFC22_000119 [Naganishia vaughanmartiniae]|uniref:Uncharacterized protein n=1 Tax=Naganishia vaughanmartiniae TaxID=1424756 RepID=A0ACC2XNH2_9TREE|nr:hypothetical protein QFC22_000119 [Naganishia vaughanmartiniae]
MRLRKIAQKLPQPLSPALTSLIGLLDREGSIKSTDQVVFTEKTTVLGLVTKQQELEHEETPHLVHSPRELDVAYHTLLEHCIAVEAARPTSADVLLKDEEEKAQDLHWDGTGLEGLDEVLLGFEGRGIFEMTGKAGAGKTEPDSVLDRMNIVDCFDMDELRSVLRDIDSSLAFGSLVDNPVDLDDDNQVTDLGRGDTASSGSVRLIVIDTLSNLLAPIITGSTTQGKYYLALWFKCIAQTPVSALPTFPASAFSTTNLKPPLGASFTYFPDISLLLQKSTDVFVMDVHERRMTAGARAAGQNGSTGGSDEGNDSRVVVEVIKNRTGASGFLTGVPIAYRV